jgi:hypothetical protein
MPGVTGLSDDLVVSRSAIASSPWIRGSIQRPSVGTNDAASIHNNHPAAMVGERWFLGDQHNQQDLPNCKAHSNLSPRYFTSQDLVPSSYRSNNGQYCAMRISPTSSILSYIYSELSGTKGIILAYVYA